MLDYPIVSDPSVAGLDGRAEVVQGVFEPPNGLVLRAIGRNKLIVLVAAVIFALIGMGIAATRKHTYTASATVQVGQVNPNSPGFFGYVQSSASLATAFSRAIDAEQVLTTVHDKLKLTPSSASARLSAEPLPEAPAFRVIATGSTEVAAVTLANVAAGAIIAYISQSNSANPEAASLLHEYSEAATHLQKVSVAASHLHRGKGASVNEIVRVGAEKTAAAARLKAIGVAYTAAVASQAPRTGLVSLLAGATSASSNRSAKIELFGFIGFLVGVIVGCAAAVLRERFRTSRRPAAELKAEMQGPQPA